MNWSHSILGWFSTDFRKLKILSQHLLPQSRVREFLGKQVSEQPRYRAGLIPHRSSCVCGRGSCLPDLAPTDFSSGSWATFPPRRTVPYTPSCPAVPGSTFCTLPLCGWETCLEMWSPEKCVVLWTVGKACSCWEVSCPVSEAVMPHG